MRTIPKISTGWARGGIAVLLALVLALRVMALPMVMAANAPGPGMMAICTGSDIIYIPIGGDSPADPGEGTAHDPCPAFGITAALDLPDLTVPALSGRLVSRTVRPAHPARVTRPSAPAHQPRAPPIA